MRFDVRGLLFGGDRLDGHSQEAAGFGAAGARRGRVGLIYRSATSSHIDRDCLAVSTYDDVLMHCRQSGNRDIFRMILSFDCTRAVRDLRRGVLVLAGITRVQSACATLRKVTRRARDEEIRAAHVETKGEGRPLLKELGP